MAGEKEYCYFCGKESISKEHVPPKCLFPEMKDSLPGKDYRRNLITVPSCALHNLEKSKEDEYLLAVLSLNILNNRTGTNQAITKTLRTFIHSEKFKERFFNLTHPIFVKDIKTGRFERSISIELDCNRLDAILEHIARGIYFHHFKECLKASLKVIDEFSMKMDPADPIGTVKHNNEFENMRNMLNAFFYEADRFGENQEVFFYQIASDVNTIIIRLSFYEGARVSCLIKLN